jgi:hypothetical protein
MGLFASKKSVAPLTLLSHAEDGTTANQEVYMAKNPAISYTPGNGPKSKPYFHCGKGSVPTSVITRLAKETEGKKEQAVANIFYAKMFRKYESFLAGLDAADITYPDALAMMAELVPAKAKPEGTGRTRTKNRREVIWVAKALSLQLKGGADYRTGMMALLGLLETVEFQDRVFALLENKKTEYGTDVAGKVRFRSQNPRLVENDRKARSAKSKAKK